MNRKGKASVTLEASLLMPLIIMLLISILCFSEYVSDVVGARAILQEYAVSVPATVSVGVVSEEELTKALREGLLITDLCEAEVLSGKEGDFCRIRLQWKVPFFEILHKDILQEKVMMEKNRDHILRQKVLMDVLELQKNQK